jgi:hypothetical protein
MVTRRTSPISWGTGAGPAIDGEGGGSVKGRARRRTATRMSPLTPSESARKAVGQPKGIAGEEDASRFRRIDPFWARPVPARLSRRRAAEDGRRVARVYPKSARGARTILPGSPKRCVAPGPGRAASGREFGRDRPPFHPSGRQQPPVVWDWGQLHGVTTRVEPNHDGTVPHRVTLMAIERLKNGTQQAVLVRLARNEHSSRSARMN